MKSSDKWMQQARSRLSQFPLFRNMPQDIQAGVARGIFVGAVACLILGGFFGALNRGPVGTLVGAISGALLGAVLGGLIGGVMGMFYPQGDARASISIDLDSGAGRYAPGETISGYVEIKPENTFRTSGGSLYFLCRGQYLSAVDGGDGRDAPKMDRDARQYLLQQILTIPGGTLRRGASLRYPFSAQVPEDALPTHHGYICSVRWTLMLALEGPDETDLKAEQELLVEAKPPALTSAREGYRSSVEAPDCQLVLKLGRAVCAEGESLKAEAHIMPLKNFAAREVRALLLRIEHTPKGDDHTVFVSAWNPATGQFRGERRPGGKGTTYVWLEEEARLSGPMHFEAGEAETLACTLNVPAQWRPTLLTKESEVIWKVALMIVRDPLNDIRALHEVIVHTGVSQLSQVLAPEGQSLE
jgi:hypothetical protein